MFPHIGLIEPYLVVQISYNFNDLLSVLNLVYKTHYTHRALNVFKFQNVSFIYAAILSEIPWS